MDIPNRNFYGNHGLAPLVESSTVFAATQEGLEGSGVLLGEF